MARTVDERRRAELLETIVDYVVANGLGDLQLRPLAKAVGSSPRVLLYYYTSKEDLIVEVLARVGVRQRELFETLPRNAETYADAVGGLWKMLSAPNNENVFRLFFEIYGLALADRTRFPDFFARAVGGWLAYIEAPLLRDGYPAAEARAIATVMLAGFRGFLLDLLATRERKRLDRAVEIWIASLDAIPPPSKAKKSAN